MPCNCDHLEPNQYEIESKLACQLLTYALPLVNKDVPEWIIKGANDFYGNYRKLEEATMMLCNLCRSMDENKKDEVIYNGRNSEARKLADWWDKHEKADALKNKKEKEKLEKEVLKDSALKKLTPEERAALDLK
jgi:hypothetical protein